MRNFNYTKKISLISMYNVETRADNSGYTTHRVIYLVVIGSSFDSEQVFQVSNTFDSFWEMDSDKKLNRKLNRPRQWRWRRSDDNSSAFFLWKVELKRESLWYQIEQMVSKRLIKMWKRRTDNSLDIWPAELMQIAEDH